MYMSLKPSKHKIISFNTTTMTSLGLIIVGPPPPSPTLIKGGGYDLPKIESLGGATTVQSYFVCEGKVRFLYYFLALQSFELAMQDSDPGFYCTKT